MQQICRCYLVWVASEGAFAAAGSEEQRHPAQVDHPEAGEEDNAAVEGLPMLPAMDERGGGGGG